MTATFPGIIFLLVLLDQFVCKHNDGSELAGPANSSGVMPAHAGIRNPSNCESIGDRATVSTGSPA